MADLSPEREPLFDDTGRGLEVIVGLLVLAVAAMLGFFGVRGALMYFQGSRAAPADPVACAVGLVAGLWGGYIALRLILGWHEDRALLPTLVLVIGGAASILGGVWGLVLQHRLHGSVSDQARPISAFGLVGVLAIVLAWRRRRGQD